MSEYRNFLRPSCSRNTIDIYPSRNGVLTALLKQSGHFYGTVLDIGCGQMPYKSIVLSPPSRAIEYIGLDLDNNIYGRPDLRWDGQTIPLDDERVDCAIATEVFEHCAYPEDVMRQIYRVLKPSGLLFFTVPFLWPLHDSPHDEYRYTPFALNRHLKNVGFQNIDMESLGGWDASLAQMIGLWVRRRQMGQWRRRLLSMLAVPVVSHLMKRDVPSPVYTDQMMITAIAGTARKPTI